MRLNYATDLNARRFGVASLANSSFGIVNVEPPQFKQTKIFGNTHTVGVVKFSGPGKVHVNFGKKLRLIAGLAR